MMVKKNSDKTEYLPTNRRRSNTTYKTPPLLWRPVHIGWHTWVQVSWTGQFQNYPLISVVMCESVGAVNSQLPAVRGTSTYDTVLWRVRFITIWGA